MDSRRARYLHAMGVTRWVPRDQSSMKGAEADLPTDELRYVLRFRAVTTAGTVCVDRTYSLKAARTYLFCDASTTLLPSHLYGELPLSPLASKVVLLSLEGLEETPDRLQIRLEYAQPSIHDVCIRVYHRKDIPDYKLYATWQRLPRHERANLAKFNVYDEELLRMVSLDINSALEEG